MLSAVCLMISLGIMSEMGQFLPEPETWKWRDLQSATGYEAVEQ